MTKFPEFDCQALFRALDRQRAERRLDWPQVGAEMTEQSADLRAELGDHAVCAGAVLRLPRRGTVSCQYALVMLRWLDRSPEDFLTGPTVDVGAVRLPSAGPGHRLRWNLPSLHAALDERRRELDLTWVALGDELECSPSRLTNLRTGRLADLDLTMRVTQWLGQPSSRFIEPATW